MTQHNSAQTAATNGLRRSVVSSLTLLHDRRLRRILTLAGRAPRLAWPCANDTVLIWGGGATAERGARLVARTGATPVFLEDGFLRSVQTGRAGDPPLGLLIDQRCHHFDPSQPSDLEDILAGHPLDDTALLDRARAAIARLRAAHLSKYNGFDPDAPHPNPGYVLVIDQTAGDASVRASKGTKALFREMLADAQIEHPGQRVLIRTHPETAAGHRLGHFTSDMAGGLVSFCDSAHSPHHLLEGATAVYTLSSQMGFEAILAGHRPHVYGQPFYSGWGLSEDRNPVARRERRLTVAQLFAAAMILYPVWYDPYHDRLCALEQVIDTLEAETRAHRADRAGWVATGMRLWKRRTVAQFFGGKMRFADDPERAVEIATATGRQWMVWAAKAAPDWACTRVEDGFLRSRGLGADLVPPLSLVSDARGIYYDPTRPSDLEIILNDCADLRADQVRRAGDLIALIRETGVSKYNLGGAMPDLPAGRRILVPGQVGDDASIRLGAGQADGDAATNLALLLRARAENPDAVILYKPHPDVEAGLRDGALSAAQTHGLADLVVTQADPIALLDHVDAVWTMTSTLGFEALMRGVPVVTLGAPFYAGWGLTRDLGTVPARRTARLTLAQLVYGVLIAYPRYVDPVTTRPCPPEVAVARLADGRLVHGGLALRLLAKAQGLAASYAHLWR